MRRDDPGHGAGGAGEDAGGRRADPVPADGAFAAGMADGLAALLARAVRAPAALVHLVDGDRLLLYGSHGLRERREELADTPLRGSLASIVVATGGPLIVDDVLADDRMTIGRRVSADGPAAYAGHPVRDAGGAVVGVCCAYDRQPRHWTPDEMAAVAEAARVSSALFTEQRARHDVERDRRFLDAVLDSLHDGVAACDGTGQVVLANARMRQMWDGAAGSLNLEEPATLAALRHPDGRPVRRDELSLFRALRGERPRDEEVVRHQGQRPRHYLIDAQPITGPDGAPAGAVMAVQDVTRRRRAERFRTCELAVTTALAEAPTVEDAAPRVLEAVAGTLGWAHAELWLVDAAAEMLRPAARWSAPGSSSMVAVPVALAYGQGLAGRAWQAGKPLWIRDVGQPQSLISRKTAITGGLHTALAIPVRIGDQSLGVLTAFAETIEDPEDELVALMSGIAAHIGQFVERRLVEDLQRQLVRSKEEYLALIGHELRTPLTSISAYIGLLREADAATMAEQGPRLLEVVDRNTDQLRKIINELLELSALDTGYASVQAAPVDLAEMVREAVDGARAAITGGPLTVAADLPDDLVVPGDGQRLRQAIDNLLGNAVKFSPDGGVIAVRLRPVGGSAELVVADAGIGIAPEERDRVFARMYRTAQARDRAIPGTGLGLAFSRAVVERHHGTIELLSHAGPGTTVLVRLPLAVPVPAR